ncbi:DNA polymerase epsilon subunit 3-like [Daphnia carinata]|uniref:DNA polymerase epsilon subunit 3-like n=1 Tax=Daphnia carinata TaxID=120202 RepID=UPI00257982A2|nr:DNA polymerase epsilon subunit 3-like [Daphnia carinata]XP_057377901.1 DNA polymerase epsilon subunit 3-like [Daphnia carinata]
MAERPEDLNLPNSIVARIIKDSLPEGVNVSKEARTAIAKAASVFVLYCTSCSNNLAMRANRKIISGQDVLGAMADMEFEKFIEPLQASLEVYKKVQKERKEAVAKRKQEKSDKKPEDVEEASDEGGENEKENEDEDGNESS